MPPKTCVQGCNRPLKELVEEINEADEDEEQQTKEEAKEACQNDKEEKAQCELICEEDRQEDQNNDQSASEILRFLVGALAEVIVKKQFRNLQKRNDSLLKMNHRQATTINVIIVKK